MRGQLEVAPLWVIYYSDPSIFISFSLSRETQYLLQWCSYCVRLYTITIANYIHVTSDIKWPLSCTDCLEIKLLLILFQAFSINGLDTITTIDPSKQNVIGQRNTLSFEDLQLLNRMYPCSESIGFRSAVIGKCKLPLFLSLCLVCF